MVDFDGNSRSIEDIEVGDYVLARSEFDAEGPLELKRVEEKFVRVAPVMELVVQGQVITTTAEHPFYVAREERFVPAGELTLEDSLVDSQGFPVAIEAIRPTDRLITVYNLRVADFHTYFVGGKLWKFDAWVHNARYAPIKAADLPWARPGAARAAKAIEAGQSSIKVASRDDAAELVWRMFSSRGFLNTTGRSGSDVRKIVGSKAGTYHWDDVLDASGNVAGHGADNAHAAMRHVQVHLENGDIIRIFFP